MTWSLTTLCGGIDGISLPVASAGVSIQHITIDSRECVAGSLFIAYAGHNSDGRDYIADAIAAGASAVLTTADVTVDGALHLSHPHPQDCVATIAANAYPAVPQHLFAVTGTNGKTSVASFCRQLLAGCNHIAASIGTLGVQIQRGTEVSNHGSNAGLTSADPISLRRTLCELADAGVTHACLEASSHGLDQGRLNGLPLQVAAFTNLSRDHLDYHGSMEVYLEAKKQLFSHVLAASPRTNKTAVLPSESEHLASLREGQQQFMMTYGNGGHVTASKVTYSPTGLAFTLRYGEESQDISLPLIGSFQIENITCAIAMLLAADIPFGLIMDATQQLSPVAGRMEMVAPNVVVDYAHTPDALQKALESLREHTPDGRLHVLFGCGGDRDVGKRAEMGKVAAECADVVTITDDNPRTEDAAGIRRMIMEACAGASEVPDRKTAIEHTIGALGKHDTLLIAGKGHENYQLIGTEQLPFSDTEVVRAVLK